MKLHTLLNEIRDLRLRLPAAIAAAAGMVVAAPAAAQDYYDEHYEWESDEGLHEEEWYDPSDWFDDDIDEDLVDYETDWWDYYGYDYDADEYDAYDPYYDYDYEGYEYYDDRYDYGDYNEYGYDYYDYEYPQYDSDNGSQTAREQPRAELHGELDGWKRVAVQGQRDAHTLVRLRLDNGRTQIVNLGPNVPASRLDLDQGERVTVHGSYGAIDGRTVLLADRIRAGDRTVTMRDWDRGTQRQAAQGAQADRQRGDQQRQARQDDQRRDRPYQQREVRRDRQERSSAMHPGAQVVQRVISGWPSVSKQAAQSMLKKYGKPDGVTPELLVWHNTGPFVKTIVHKRPVDHNFPKPHEDVLEQFVNLKVPADKMDDLAKFDGSVIVYRTDGLVSAMCDKEAMNILALNLASDVVEGEKSAQEARSSFAEAAQAFMQGQRPSETQRLTFDSAPRNVDQADAPDERHREESRTTSR